MSESQSEHRASRRRPSRHHPRLGFGRLTHAVRAVRAGGLGLYSCVKPSASQKREASPSEIFIRPAKLGRRSFVMLLVLLWSALLGTGLAQVTRAQVTRVQVSGAQVSGAQVGQLQPPPNPTGTVDTVTESYRLGQQYYLESCATCHVGLPPAVMPSQTWASILPDSQHYGAQITPITEPLLQIVWNYVSTYSRPVKQDERVPYRLQQSRFFKAIHPKVEFTEPITVNSCIACHPAAAQFDYRSLSAEWEGAD
jgi:mono/diheme cytochrome c family protein